MGSYMHAPGVGDYNLPDLTGGKVCDSMRRSNPQWSFKSRTKLGYFPYRQVEFVGKSSPAPTRYTPKPDN